MVGDLGTVTTASAAPRGAGLPLETLSSSPGDCDRRSSPDPPIDGAPTAEPDKTHRSSRGRRPPEMQRPPAALKLIIAIDKKPSTPTKRDPNTPNLA